MCTLIQSLATSDWAHIWIVQLTSGEFNVSKKKKGKLAVSACDWNCFWCSVNETLIAAAYFRCLVLPPSCSCRCYPSSKANREVRTCLTHKLWSTSDLTLFCICISANHPFLLSYSGHIWTLMDRRTKPTEGMCESRRQMVRLSCAPNHPQSWGANEAR